ncbi:MAG: M81 family metallopeptidase [Geminicoccaceae bacterium]
MRFVLAEMMHETNTFSPIPTPLEAFAMGTGRAGPLFGTEAALERFEGTNTTLGGLIEVARKAGAEIAVPIAGGAPPSGRVADAAFETFAEAISGAVAHGCDAVLLALHGAMATESHDDGEGELLRRIRAVASNVPIGVALDFHTNMSRTMVEDATVITGYRTYPHIDMADTALRAGRVLVRALKGEARPVMRMGKLPMLTHTLKQGHDVPPLKDIMDRAVRAEASGEVLACSVFGGFPMADIPHVGFTAIVVSDGDPEKADALVGELLDMAWGRRAGFVYRTEPIADSIAAATRFGAGPIVLVDHGDNVFSGGTQDVMATVAEALRQGLESIAIGPIWDPASVQRMIEAGVGSEITLELGGRTNMPALGLRGEPLRVGGRVRKITEGRYRVTCPMMTGVELDHGACAVLDTGRAEILVASKRMEPFDLGVFRHAGIEPTAKRYLLIKSRQHFRAGFAPIAKRIVMVSGPGVTSSDYGLFKWTKVPRPLYPLDPDMARPG